MASKIADAETSGSPKKRRTLGNMTKEFFTWLIVVPIGAAIALMIAKAAGVPPLAIGALCILVAIVALSMLFKPSDRLPIGRARAIGLLWATFIAFGVANAPSVTPTPTVQAQSGGSPSPATQASAAASPQAQAASSPTLYPWPFDAPSVTLTCRNPAGHGMGMVTATAPDGQEYAINGLAKSRYPDVRPIWLDNPELAGTKINIGPAIDRGLALCLGSGQAAAPLRVTPGTAPPAPPPQPTPVAEKLPKIDDSAFELHIVSAEETAGEVRGQIETNMPLPIEIMVSVSLRGQAGDDTYIGNNERLQITASPQAFSVPTTSSRGGLPSGEYDVEANFYPRWGGEKGPPEARAISREISATRRITLRGTGASASDVKAKNDAQKWLMENTAMGDRWNPAEFERRMGPSEKLTVTNRTAIIVAYYYPRADATVFVNTLKNELDVWRLGKQTSE